MENRVKIKMITDLAEAEGEMRKIGADAAGIKIMSPKAIFQAIKVSGVTSPAANILKQEMLAKGGEAVVAKGVVTGKKETSDVLLLGTHRQYQLVIARLYQQPFGLKKIAEKIEDTLNNFYTKKVRTLDCRGKQLILGERTLIMGVLNLTPDSFSDGGSYNTGEEVLARARELAAQGADIIDLGAESTRPGSIGVSLEEELDRLLPYLPRLLKEIDLPISLDTYKPEVAEAGLKLGVHILNDIWGLQGNPRMAEIAARYGCPVIVMHNQQGTEYEDLLTDVYSFLERSILIAEQAGIDREKLIVDPGIGFGKTAEHNLELLKYLAEFNGLGCPILVGSSRKSFIGKVLDLPVGERDEGTAATVALAVAGGADIVRVHRVEMMARVAKMADAVVRWRHG
jgi:dihydropteroate synthase